MTSANQQVKKTRDVPLRWLASRRKGKKGSTIKDLAAPTRGAQLVTGGVPRVPIEKEEHMDTRKKRSDRDNRTGATTTPTRGRSRQGRTRKGPRARQPGRAAHEGGEPIDPAGLGGRARAAARRNGRLSGGPELTLIKVGDRDALLDDRAAVITTVWAPRGQGWT